MTNNDLIMVARLMAPGGLVDTGKKNGFEVSKTEGMPSFFAPTISDDAYAKLPKTMSRFDSRVSAGRAGFLRLGRVDDAATTRLIWLARIEIARSRRNSFSSARERSTSQ